MQYISKSAALSPTNDAYDELSSAYDFFNGELFENQLPKCLITLQRKKRTCGYFHASRFVTIEGKKTDEIAMNPMYFAAQPARDVLSTLVHEMVHLWQRHFGKPSRTGYHNREWANKMLSVGLHPSSTGRPGGREVGQLMSDYVIEGGIFSASVDRLLASDWSITWFDRYPVKLENSTRVRHTSMSDEPVYEAPIDGAPSGLFAVLPATVDQSNRRKYQCPTCHAAVWGKPGLAILCGDCGSGFDDVSSGNNSREKYSEINAQAN